MDHVATSFAATMGIVTVNRIVRKHVARAWQSLAEAEEFALEQGWHPVTDEVSRRLHGDETR